MLSQESWLNILIFFLFSVYPCHFDVSFTVKAIQKQVELSPCSKITSTSSSVSTCLSYALCKFDPNKILSNKNNNSHNKWWPIEKNLFKNHRCSTCSNINSKNIQSSVQKLLKSSKINQNEFQNVKICLPHFEYEATYVSIF